MDVRTKKTYARLFSFGWPTMLLLMVWLTFPAHLLFMKIVLSVMAPVGIFINLRTNKVCNHCGTYNWGLTTRKCPHCKRPYEEQELVTNEKI
ncbi:MAG: hypothetical protein ACE5HO_04400 [bacterium]